MTEPIFDPNYWAERLVYANDTQRHHAIYLRPLEEWQDIENDHREILKTELCSTTSVLDAGCGYGRLLNLMPKNWKGGYLGLDLSPDFIRLAKKEHPANQFKVADLRDLSFLSDSSFDVAVLISIRNMILANVGKVVWDQIESELHRVCKRLLFLEYKVRGQNNVKND